MFIRTTLGVLVLGGIFAFAVYQFRTNTAASASVVEEEKKEVVADPDSALKAHNSLDKQSPRADLAALSARGGRGTAVRGLRHGRYLLNVDTNIVNTSIDRATQQYEVWLLRPIPYDFINIGPMISNNVGFFYTEWEGEEGKEYGDYTQVLITLEPKDDVADPGEKVLFGEFGKGK